MKQSISKIEILPSLFEDTLQDQQLFFQPLAIISLNKIKTQIKKRVSQNKAFVKLDYDKQVNIEQQKNYFDLSISTNIQGNTQEQVKIDNDHNLKKILNKTNNEKPRLIQQKNNGKYQLFSFHFDKFQQKYEHTPLLKQISQTPISKFNTTYKSKILHLSDISSSQQKFAQLQLTCNPTTYYQKPGSFFVGIALTLSKQYYIYESLYFFKLAIYLEPYNSKIWKLMIEGVKKIGWWKQGCILAKTGFIFNPFDASLAEEYLRCGDKTQTPMYEVRGLLPSLKNPLIHEKILVQLARYQMKYRKVWRGVLLLNRFLSVSIYKNCLNQGIMLLVKFFISWNFQLIALKFLEIVIERGMNKLEAFQIYIQLNVVVNGGLYEHHINFIDNHINNIKQQVKFRVYLLIVQTLIKTKDRNYQKYLIKSHQLINKHCKLGSGKDRAIRCIYITIIMLLNLPISDKILEMHMRDQRLLFVSNRYQYINKGTLTKYQFRDWKYFLHYSLVKNSEILISAAQKFQQGRLIAQAIHVLRLTNKPLNMLKIWRNKIEKMPKSGELWCEGGRIYFNLLQFDNAAKCFHYAIHFTPQFGDSFFELLKVYLLQNQFQAIHQLKKVSIQLLKNFIFSEPHYGSVLSFLQNQNAVYNMKIKSNLSQVWTIAQFEIRNQQYSGNTTLKYALTALPKYNEAFINPKSREIRQILMACYEDMESLN